jgi:[acyl-carrier-protein] S-malonyltransferase
MSVALLFPGQGSQKLGMGADFRFTGVFGEVDDALGFKLSDIIFGDDADALNQTENTQPALFAASVAAYRAAGEPGADFVLGHSLGEYGALACAGAMSLADGARLLRARGLAMKKAPAGAMMAVIGLELERVGDICSSFSDLYVANDNCPGQVVVSGTKSSVAAAEQAFKDAGSKRAIPLAVSVPAHCPLMQGAREEMEEMLAGIPISAPKIPFVSNRTAAIDTDPAAIKAHLAEQMTNGVRFRECVEFIAASGVTRALELGSGGVLCGLVRRTTDKIAADAIENNQNMEILK